MKDDDPEKRIRELERGLADMTRTPPSVPPTGEAPYKGYAPPTSDAPYTGNAPYTSNASYTPNAPYAGGEPYAGGAPYGLGFPPPRRRKPYPWVLVFIVLWILLPTIISLLMHFVRSTPIRSNFGNGSRTTAPSNGPTAVPQGGELRVGGSMETKTIACNDGNLTLYGTGSTYSVTGHCANLKVGGYNNNVTVDNADTLESTGYSNTVTDRACNNCKLTLSSYGIEFDVTGHAANLTISSYDNKVTVDSTDTINVSGYDNVVTYHSGTPKITDSGRSNTIQHG
jgi:hypothetical protein